MTGAVSTSAPTAAGVRAASAGTSSDRRRGLRSLPKDAMTQPAASPVARSVIAGSPPPGCSASKRRAIGPISADRAQQPCTLVPAIHQPHQDRCLRPVHRPDRLRLEQRPALCEGRRRGHRRPATTASRRRDQRGLRLRQRNPLGWHGRRRPRIRLCAELVGCGRIRSPVHGHTRPRTSRAAAGRRFSRTDRIGQDVDLVTVRVNYRWGGPVIAKY